MDIFLVSNLDVCHLCLQKSTLESILLMNDSTERVVIVVNVVLVVFFACPRIATESREKSTHYQTLKPARKIMDEKKRQVWRFVIQTAISILTAIATALGVTSCMAAV